jgi:hypothetical protein
MGGPKNAFARYDMDYWGNSVLQAVQWADWSRASGIPLIVSGNPIQAVDADARTLPLVDGGGRANLTHHLDIRLMRGPSDSPANSPPARTCSTRSPRPTALRSASLFRAGVSVGGRSTEADNPLSVRGAGSDVRGRVFRPDLPKGGSEDRPARGPSAQSPAPNRSLRGEGPSDAHVTTGTWLTLGFVKSQTPSGKIAPSRALSSRERHLVVLRVDRLELALQGIADSGIPAWKRGLAYTG